jgi:uncharacterized protein YggE
MGSLTVRGRGTAAASPDEIEIVLEVAAIRDQVADAFADVVERAAVLEAVCDELGIERSARRATNVSVHEYQDYDGEGGGSRKHRAASRLSLRLADLEPVPGLLRAAVERAQARVEGPLWRVADDNPARVEACRLAVADANRRAEAYAGALGRRLGALERAIDTSGGQPVHGAATFGMALEADLPVHAAELEVAAVVELTYELENA